MSSALRPAAIPAMIGLGRAPDLNAASCAAMYSACCPARCGLAGAVLVPSAPWQAAQTVVAICFPRSISTFGAAGAVSAAPATLAYTSAMAAAKPVKARIRKPREIKGEGSKPKDFTVLDFGSAAFTISVHDPRELPPPAAPEIAFVGRSNAGKSSAINALANRRRLAFVSKTPGRTQLINFFALGRAAFLVDLPGYGYAGVPGAVRQHWETLVGHYVANRPSLALVVVIMDIRHPLTVLDRQLPVREHQR